MSLLAARGHADLSLSQSRDYCAQLTRAQARNFYYGLKLLPEPKRSAMFALYAYMRLVDDIADDQDGQSVSHRIEALDAWAKSTAAAVSGNPPPDHPIWPAFSDMVQTHSVPASVFQDVIAGQRQDLESANFHTFAELRGYCYRVAGVVGVASIHVWGFEGGQHAINLAIDRGIAFQLTNILRDLREDAARGRSYLPRQELEAAGLSHDDLLAARAGERFNQFMRLQIERVQSYYDQSAPLDELVNADSRPTLRAMTEIYHGLLELIAADPRRVLFERVSLSTFAKVRIAWRAARSR
jgi:phytoene synthase